LDRHGWFAGLGRLKQQRLLQLLLSRHRYQGLPEQFRRVLQLMLLRHQYQDVLLYGLLPEQGQELLLQVGMLQELLLLV
jgi:hypothetical protein